MSRTNLTKINRKRAGYTISFEITKFCRLCLYTKATTRRCADYDSNHDSIMIVLQLIKYKIVYYIINNRLIIFSCRKLQLFTTLLMITFQVSIKCKNEHAY